MDATLASELYRRQVLEHGRAPRHAGRMQAAQAQGEAAHADCGDRIALQLRFDHQGRVLAALHQSEGCLLSIASASLLCEAIHGLERVQIARLEGELRAALRGEAGPGLGLGELQALLGVRAFPARQRCALLAWDALRQALDERPA